MDATDKENPPASLPAWPKCQEPFQSELANLSQAWLAGELTHERLALELIKQAALARHVSQPAPGLRRIPVGDVLSQITILSDALLAAIELERNTLPALRQEAFDFNRTRTRPNGHPGLM